MCINSSLRKLASRSVRQCFKRTATQLDLDENAFAIYTVLRNAIGDVTPEQARSVDQVFAQFPDYQWDDHQQSQLRMTLYSTLRPTVNVNELVETTNKLLQLKRVKI